MINILILIIANLFFMLTIGSMLVEINNLSKKKELLRKEKNLEEEQNIEGLRNSMIVYVVMGTITYASFIKLIVEMYTNK